MATILSGDVGVQYLGSNRQKRIYWIGGTNTEYTLNELYSAMATLLDETTTIDDGTAFSAETPVEYTTGKIDAGDTEPWYVSFDLMEHITGGALRTSGWQRVQDSNTGIVVVAVEASGGTIVAGDAGYDITHGDGDAGTLLEFIDTGGSIDYCVIRPDSSAIANSFDNGTGTLTCNSHTATVDTAATTGEQIWANLYSLGTIDANVHLYLYQGEAAADADRVRLFSWNDSTQDWYGNGHIDICVALKDITASTWSVIDGGYITVFARKYGDMYASFEVACSTTSGGRNPIPLQTAADIDNTTGYKRELTGAWSGSGYVVGEIISGGTSGARGIVTAAVTDTSIDYIPIDDPQVDFENAETITGATSSTTSTSSGTPSDQGPALATWFTSNTKPTATFAATTADIDDDSTDENYGITIDCKSNPLTEVYEWIKYACRNGEITDDLDGINGERYIGGEVYLKWTGSISGTISEGSDVTQETSGATGVIIALSVANKVMLLRDTRGTFGTGASDHTLTDNDQSGTVEIDDTATTFAPKTASPLGTFAGGTFFGARGVLLSNYLAADENSFILTPIEGGTKERPVSISMEVTNLDGGAETSNLHDRVSMFRLTGSAGDVDKTEYDCAGGEAAGANTITVSGSIAQDVPGKTNGGMLVLVDDPAGTGDEYALRYASWTGSVFTLNEITGTATAGTNATTLVDSGATFTDGADQVHRGDLVYVSGKGWAYVKTVDSDTQLTLVGTGISGFTTSDGYEINVPPIAITSSDDLYVPFIMEIATTSSMDVSVVYSATIYYRVKVRNTRAATKIKPFSVDGSTSGADVSVPVIRQDDTIIS
jgi:hypothetical protein